jgi:hypothetical protein
MIKKYSTENILEGTYYRSTNRYPQDGLITYATKRPEIWVGENAEAYAVKVRPIYNPSDPKTWGKDFWATIAVSHSD